MADLTSMTNIDKEMKKGHRKIKILIAALFAAAIAAFMGAVFYGYFHINGWTAEKYPIRGVDVSHYQGDIDWPVLSRQNLRFAYIKATEGSSHIDETFALNYEKARKTDLKVGVYHFFSFDSPGLDQAEHFIHTTELFPGMIPPVVDVEFYGNKREHPPAPDQVETELRAFLLRVEQIRGQRPVIYATEESWNLYLQGNFDDYPLWFRDIWKKPKIKSAGEDQTGPCWTFWQYTNRGRLKGFSGEESFVDLNVFYGAEEEWAEFTAPSGS